MKKANLYWYCQFLGWGSALVYWSFYSFNNSLPWQLKLAQLFIPFLFSIYTTHLYRNWAHRNGMLTISIQALLPKLFLGLLLLTIGYIVMSFLLGSYVYGNWIVNALPGIISGGLRYMAIWLLAFHLYHYAKRESKLELEKSRLEALALQSKIDALAHELNPHFLFNSLNSIKSLVHEDPELSKRAIVLLSNLLRHTLNQSEDSFATIATEMEAVRDYLEMESLRFEERLCTRIDIAPDTMHLKIPSLGLLNLIENAVKHGVAISKQKGNLQINISQTNNQLVIVILNPGLLKHSDNSGIGNRNLNERIKLLYQGKANLSLRQKEQGMVETKLLIPIEPLI